MTQAPQPEDGYSEVVHHANVSSSLAYVARKTGFGFQKTERLLELALQRGDLAEGDYSGRKLGRYHDDRARALEAENEQLRAQLAAQAPERKPLTDEQISDMRGADLGRLNFVTLREFRTVARAIEAAHGIKEGGSNGAEPG